MELNLSKAEFVVESEEGADVDPNDLRVTIETWGGYDYKVGEIKVLE